MPKKTPRRRKYKRYLRGNLDHKLDLGTLAGNTLVGSLIADTVVDTTWCSSVTATWSLVEMTAAEGDGPIIVGVAHSDYTDAEVEAFVENITGSWDQGDLVSQEISRRKIKIVGQFEVPEDSTKSSILNDGRQMTTKCGFLLSEGDTLRVWAYNAGDSALATTNPFVRCNGHANLWPTG